MPTTFVRFQISSVNVLEDVGDIEIRVALTEPSDQVVTVQVYQLNGQDQVEFTTQTVTFQPGETEQFVTATVISDEIFEGFQISQFGLTSPTNAEIDPVYYGFSVSINDDDVPSGVLIYFPDNNYGVAESAGEVQIRVALTEPSDQVVTVQVYQLNGQDQVQFTTQTVTFQPGETEQFVTATVISDEIFEGLQISQFGLTNPTNGEIHPVNYGFSINISDDDAPVPDIPADISTTTELQVGESLQSLLSTTTDVDFIRIQLTAGQTYLFSLDGSGGLPVVDPSLFLLDSEGTAITFNDNGGAGLNAELRFQAETSGDYFLTVVSLEGDVGDYTLSAGLAPPQNPLDTITWGSPAAPSVIPVWFGASGIAFDGATGTHNWTQDEIDAVMSAMNVFSDYINVTFTAAASADEALVVLLLDDTLESLGEAREGDGRAILLFDPDPVRWNAATLEPGGSAHWTVQHEVAHGLGLAHPHDWGGDSERLDGVFDQFASYGEADLNQTVFTIMSYNAGWTTGPTGPTLTRIFGHPETPMALDIAVLQSIYGAPSINAGDNLYILGLTGTYACIWDTGGTDTIANGLNAACVIDLRAATLELEEGGGGFVSYNSGFLGGLTIAHGAVIENAVGGLSNDRLIGNQQANVLWGADGNDNLQGGDGDDILDGGEQIDTAVFSGARADYTITNDGFIATVVGIDGTDTLSAVEYFQFDDQTIRWLPGEGVSVNFDADPDNYMAAIRDFSGNNLGGADSWVLAGSVDIQGDGDVEYIYFNAEIGRWATVAPAEDGLIYFSDHGWAGETRVVGTYLDPLMALNPELIGTPVDSQARFQSDLFIGNIGEILGADDYDGDGLQEVYFAIADGTAYLHAYMHADGNIRYANYQSEEQVIDFLTANGFGAETYEGWFD